MLSLIEQEKGIRTPGHYRAVLSAVAGGHTAVNAIAQAAGLGDQPHTVRRALAILEDLGLVGRERNFAAHAGAPYRYFIADNAVAFWHRFIVPHRSRLATGDPHEVWTRAVAPYLNDHMGKVFERVAAQAYVRGHQRWTLPGAQYAWARKAQVGAFLYISAAGFTEDFARWAETRPQVHLLTLDDIYLLP